MISFFIYESNLIVVISNLTELEYRIIYIWFK